MDHRYVSNRIYVTPEEQHQVRQFNILLGGAGIGSVIAECALRFGFERITIVDGDKVDMTNLNRQNYTQKDAGKYKTEALAERLLQINPHAMIKYHTCFIDSQNVEQLIAGYQVAINALDYTSDIPFLFDRICRQENIPVLHPYNLGWAGFVTVVKPDSQQLTLISEKAEGFELKMAEYVTQYLRFWHTPQNWIDELILEYKNETAEAKSPPQLSVASWIAAGLCTQIMYHLCTGKRVKIFPKFYLASVLNDIN